MYCMLLYSVVYTYSYNVLVMLLELVDLVEMHDSGNAAGGWFTSTTYTVVHNTAQHEMALRCEAYTRMSIMQDTSIL